MPIKNKEKSTKEENMDKRIWRDKKTWSKYLACLVLAMPFMVQASPCVAIEHVHGQDTVISPSNTFVRPINIEIEVLSCFGELRTDYIHQGIDLRTPIGTPIYAAADGIVTKASPDSKGLNAGGGNIIILDHGNDEQTWYMHLDSYAVALGQTVTKGQLIGYTGCTGDSTTPLLHFEYRKSGVAQNPMFIFEEEIFIYKLEEPFFVIQT